MLLFFLLHAYESKVVGVAAKQIVTSRQVRAHTIFTAYFDTKPQKMAYSLPLDQSSLMSATSNLLMEYLVVAEAKSFGLAKITDAEVKTAINRFKSRLAKSPYKQVWSNLEISDSELLDLAKVKLRSKKFLSTKVASFTVPVTEVELNAKMRSLSDKNVDPEQVKKQIQEENKQSALSEWFQLLRTKYVVKNLLLQP